MAKTAPVSAYGATRSACATTVVERGVVVDVHAEDRAEVLGGEDLVLGSVHSTTVGRTK